MKKQLQLIMSTIVMVLTSLTTYGQSVGDQFDVDGITYEITATSPAEVKIVGYTGSATEVEIPQTATDQGTDYQVTAIGDQAFNGYRKAEADKLTSVVIPDGVTSIGQDAFWTNKLTSVNIPNSVTTIGQRAFGTNQLSSVTLPNNITSIGKWVFYKNKLTSVNIPNSVTTIGQQAFGTNELSSVTLSNNLTSIGQDAFWQNKLTSVDIPNSVTTLGQRAFGTNKLNSVTLSNNITKIEQWVFSQNDIKELTIPANVDSIKYQAFYGNENLTLITVKRNPPVTFDTTAFQSRNAHLNVIIKKELVVPFGLIEAYRNAGWTEEFGFEFVTSGMTVVDDVRYAITTSPGEATLIGLMPGVIHNLVIPEAVVIDGQPVPVTAIGDEALRSRQNLVTVVIPSSMKNIGFQAFRRSFRLNLVIMLGNNPPTLDADAFDYPHRNNIEVLVPLDKEQDYKNAGWTNFKLVSSVLGRKHIGHNFTWEFTSLSPDEVALEGTAINNPVGGHVEIPSEIEYYRKNKMYSVTSIKKDVFKNRKISSVKIPDAVRRIGESAFENNFLANVTIPDGVQHIGRNAFKNNALTSVEIPDAVTRIEKGVFEGNALTNVIIPNGVQSIGVNAFRGNALTSVGIPIGVQQIEESAFEFNDLANVTIPYGVQSIGKDAFWQNQLASVEIPETVTSLGQRAFGHNNLTDVTIPNSITRIEQWVFARNDLKEVIIPANVEYIGYQAFFANDLKEVTISGNVNRIDLYAFLDNPELHLVTMEANDPPRLHKDAFSNAYRDQIDLVVPMSDTSIQVYLDNGWDGFRSISFGIFTVNGIRYGITSSTDVMVVDYTGTATAVSIPETLNHGPNIYTVTAIREDAFQNKELVNVEIPSSVISIGERAFSENLLTEVTIPVSVESIGPQAFNNNPGLGLVTVEANNPPALDATAFANANRHQIALVVPTGKRHAYEDNGWGGFRSILDGSVPPRPTIDVPQSVDHLNPFTVNITFDDDVTDFMVDDIQITNASVSVLTGSGSTYTTTIAATSLCDGNIIIDIPANVAIGANSLPNLPATAMVTIEENPNDLVANAKDITVQLDASGRATILPEQVNNGSRGTCNNSDPIFLSLDKTNFDCNDVGTRATVTLTATQGNETATATAMVTVEAVGNCGTGEPLADFNRGFSPNGDGIADTLVIEGLEKYKNNVVKIYDLSQRLLFSAHYGGPSDGWDATHKGSMVPVGSYVCVIDYNEPGLSYEAKMIYVNY